VDVSSVSVLDQRRFDAVPDLNFRVDGDPDSDPDWHQNDADPNPSFIYVGKSDFFAFYVPLPYILHLTDPCPFSK
jgi:hypothetical protein